MRRNVCGLRVRGARRGADCFSGAVSASEGGERPVVLYDDDGAREAGWLLLVLFPWAGAVRLFFGAFYG